MAFLELRYHSDALGMGVTVNVILPEQASTLIGMAADSAPTYKTLYLFSPSLYTYTNVDLSDPNADMSNYINDWVKCTCSQRAESEFYNSNHTNGFNDTDGDGRCNNPIIGVSDQSVWCWGFEEEPDRSINANPYIGTKTVTVVNGDPKKPLQIKWPLTKQFKHLDVTVDGVLIIEDGVELE